MRWLEARTNKTSHPAGPGSSRLWVAFDRIDCLDTAMAGNNAGYYVVIVMGSNVFAHPRLFATEADAEAFIENELLDNVT